MPIAKFPIGPLGTNSYVANITSNACVIDVGGEPEEILAYVEEKKLTVIAICITHRHFDHIYGVATLARETGAPVYISQGDDVLADNEAGKGGIWGLPPVPEFDAEPLFPGKTSFADMECMVLETPGHTPGGVSLYFPELKAVFSGDSLFYRSIGRTDFPMGDSAQLLKSVRQVLFTLPDDVKVYPGHGPETSVGFERRNNPFAGDFVA